MLLSADNYTLKLYELILPSLFKESPIVVFADNENAQILKESEDFQLQKRCDKSVDILVGSSFMNLPKVCKNRPIFATTHKTYISNKNVIGAFYWTKGRPQIHFKRDMLKKFHLQLAQKLQRFIDE